MFKGHQHSQFVPFDVVEETLVRSHFFRLDRLEEIPVVVGQGTHQVVFFNTGKQEREITAWHGKGRKQRPVFIDRISMI